MIVSYLILLLTATYLLPLPVGCQQEGVLRNLFPALDDNGRTVCALFSILRAEWLNGGKIKLKNKLR